MRLPYACLVALGLAACTQTVPDSRSGVGFQDYPSYVREREAALAGAAPAPLPPGGQMQAGVPPSAMPGALPPAQPEFSTERLSAAIDAAEGGSATVPLGGTAIAGMPPTGAVIGAEVGAPVTPYDPAGLAADRPRGDAPANIAVQTGEVDYGHAGISDEQDFGAVSQRETIESDAERLARNRAQYQVVQPTDVPQRTGESGPNIVAFALSTSHAPGVPMYKRSSLSLSNPEAACARYGSPDLAQEAFLAAGGPDKDRKGLDPDGDGYACSWDPRPFRAALN